MNVSEEIIIAEYQAVRDEIVFRLGAQQNIISYSLLVAGVLAPVLGLSKTLDIHIVLIVLLVGPIVCALLQLTFLKHHLWITLDYRYIDFVLGVDLLGESIFGGRGAYIRNEFSRGKLIDIYAALVGFAEGFFPSLVGGLYLFLFLVLSLFSLDQLGLDMTTCILTLWFLVDFVGLMVLIVIGVVEREWNKRYGQVRKGEGCQHVHSGGK